MGSHTRVPVSSMGMIGGSWACWEPLWTGTLGWLRWRGPAGSGLAQRCPRGREGASWLSQTSAPWWEECACAVAAAQEVGLAVGGALQFG